MLNEPHAAPPLGVLFAGSDPRRTPPCHATPMPPSTPPLHPSPASRRETQRNGAKVTALTMTAPRCAHRMTTRACRVERAGVASVLPDPPFVKLRRVAVGRGIVTASYGDAEISSHILRTHYRPPGNAITQNLQSPTCPTDDSHARMRRFPTVRLLCARKLTAWPRI